MYFENIFNELYKNKIKYLVVGGLAVNLHGFQRITGDLDIIISYDTENLVKLVEIFNKLGFKPTVPVNLNDFIDENKRKMWIEEKNMEVFSVYNPHNAIEHIDILIKNYINFDELNKRKKEITLGNISLPIISIDDLIALKKISNRERDKIDIKALLKIKELDDEKKE